MKRCRSMNFCLMSIALIAVPLASALPPPEVAHSEQGIADQTEVNVFEIRSSSQEWVILETEFDLPTSGFETWGYGGISVHDSPQIPDESFEWLLRVHDFTFPPRHGEHSAAGAGDILEEGIYQNITDHEVILILGGALYRRLEAGELLLVSDSSEFSGTGLSVTCTAGTFACCVIGPPSSARCIRNTNENVRCDGGGIGASSCSVSTN